MQRVRTLWRRLMEKPLFQKAWQFFKFGVVGLSNTLISLCVYEACVHWLGMYYLAANALGLVISVVNAYYWNNRCVFGQGVKRTPRQHAVMYLKSLTAYGGTFLLDSLLLILWVEALGVSEALAPVFNLLITIPLNFLVNKFWTFRKKE